MSWNNPAAGECGSGAGATSFDSPARDGSYGGYTAEAGTGGCGGEESGGNKYGGCFNCGQEGHSKAECPEPPKPRPCFNCGEEGHTKAECTNPPVAREFTGNCRLCDRVGHRASECPSAPPKLCNNCKEEGHTAVECKAPRKIDRSDVPDVSAEQAWSDLVAASADFDLDDMKEAVLKYIKATPDATYFDLEKAFRTQELNLYLIALEKELAPTYTNMDLQGNLDKKYSVTYRKSPNHARPKEKELWPATPEENLERLRDAGEPVDRGIPKCSNCEQLGHISKSCPEEKQENADRAVVKCYNCEGVGHRVRDCPVPRPDRFACRNCKQSGHSSRDCPEPRSAEGVECKKCNEVGHFSRDCPQGGGGAARACHNCGQEGHNKAECTNERVMICHNCDEVGHTGRDCPKPRDYSRVKCSNCQEMGHTKVRCQAPIKDEDAAEEGYGGDAGNVFGGRDSYEEVAAGGGGGGGGW